MFVVGHYSSGGWAAGDLTLVILDSWELKDVAEAAQEAAEAWARRKVVTLVAWEFA